MKKDEFPKKGTFEDLLKRPFRSCWKKHKKGAPCPIHSNLATDAAIWGAVKDA